jgi:hypothetical protein
VVQGLLIIEASRSHSDTPHSVGFLWKSDQQDAEKYTWLHRTLTQTGIHAPGRIRIRKSRKRASGHSPMPYTSQSPGSASCSMLSFIFRCLRIFAQSAFQFHHVPPSVCTYLTAQFPEDRISSNLIFDTFMKICRRNPFGQKYRTFYMKASLRFIVAKDVNRHKIIVVQHDI